MRKISKYAKKVLVAVIIVLIVSAIVATTVQLISIAVVTALLGGMIILWCHLARCCCCDSWLTETVEKYVSNDSDPHLGMVHVEKRCRRCGESEYIGDFPAEVFWRQQNPPQGF
jgi:hypothetical protein